MTTGTKRMKAVNSPCSVRGLFLLGILAMLSIGCGTKSFEAVRPGIETRGHYIDGVPFIRQTGNDCGPAALASVLAYYGRTVDLSVITSAIYIPKLRGTLPMDLEQYARTAGFQTRSSGSTLDDLTAVIARNNPVICLLDLGIGPYRRPHYVTITGFDGGNKIIIMHDGETANRTMTYEKFARYWLRAGNWMVVVYPGR